MHVNVRECVSGFLFINKISIIKFPITILYLLLYKLIGKVLLLEIIFKNKNFKCLNNY